MLGIVVVAYRNHPVTETFVRNQLPKIEADIKTVLVIVDNSSTKEESTLLARNCEAELWEGGGSEQRRQPISSPEIRHIGSGKSRLCTGEQPGIRFSQTALSDRLCTVFQR